MPRRQGIITVPGMKKIPIKLLAFIVSLACAAVISCDDGSGGGESVGGREYLLTGSWWVDEVIPGQGEGYYFDGAGGGYDLSEVGEEVTISCDKPITYTYDGCDLIVNEPGSTSGYTKREFTFEFTGDITASITISGFPFTANKIKELLPECGE